MSSRRSMIVIGVAVLSGLTLGSCSNDAKPSAEGATRSLPPEGLASASAQAQTRGVDLTAELDVDSGAVVLPNDRFQLSYDEISTLTSALGALIDVCAQAKGVHVVTVNPRSDPVYSSHQYFGPWTEAQAERFGFAAPMTANDMYFNEVKMEGSAGGNGAPVKRPAINAGLTKADWDVVDGCQGTDGTAELKGALAVNGPWTSQLYAIKKNVFDQPDARAALVDVDACYSAQGLTPDPASPWLVQGVSDHLISEAQIKLALQLVVCKKKTSFTERVSQAEARLQAPVILTYLDELLQKRQAAEAALKKSKVIIAQHPEVFDASWGR